MSTEAEARQQPPRLSAAYVQRVSTVLEDVRRFTALLERYETRWFPASEAQPERPQR